MPHELALARSADRYADAQQISFTVGSLADLREFDGRLRERGYPVDRMVSHGISLSCYFFDPEGNRVEIYWPTGRVWPQSDGVPIDLSRSEEELWAALEG